MNSPADNPLDRVLVLEMVRVTEAAAVAASRLIGRGDEKAADAAAVEAMRKAFDTLYMDGTVVIGEGERDEAPMLFIGEKVGGFFVTASDEFGSGHGGSLGHADHFEDKDAVERVAGSRVHGEFSP